MTIKITFLVVYFAIMLAIGFIQRKKANSVDNFVLGGRSVGPWISAVSYGTTFFSGVIFIGNAGQFGWKYGMSSALWIGFFGCTILATLLPWIVLARRTRVMTQHLNSATLPDFFFKRYDSRNIRLVAALIIFIFMVPYTSSIYNGLAVLFEMSFGIPFFACAIIFATLTGVYVIMGGYMASKITDFIQGIIMAGCIGFVIMAVAKVNGGLGQSLISLSQVPSEYTGTAAMQGAFTSIFGPDFKNLFMVSVMIGLGAMGLPQCVHKFYVIKGEAYIKSGTLISAVFAFIIGCGCYVVGGFARLYDSPVIYNAQGGIAYDSIVPYMISSMGDLLISLVIIMVLAASMSTLASLVISSSSTITLDFFASNVIKDMTEKKKIICMRLLIVLFIVLSLVLSIWRPTFISQLLSISWGALSGSFIGPLLYALYWKRTTRAGVWAAFICGVGITVTNLFLHYMTITNAAATTMLVSLAIVPIVSLIGRPLKKEVIDNSFSCLEQQS